MPETKGEEDSFDPSRFDIIYFGECRSGSHAGWGVEVSPIATTRFRDRFRWKREYVPDSWMFTFVPKPPATDYVDEVYVPDLKEAQALIAEHEVILLPDNDRSRYNSFIGRATRKRE